MLTYDAKDATLKSHCTKLAVVRNNSSVIAELGYPLCRSTFRLLARFIHPREKSSLVQVPRTHAARVWGKAKEDTVRVAVARAMHRRLAVAPKLRPAC